MQQEEVSRLISSDGGERKTESRVRAWVRQTGTCLTFPHTLQHLLYDLIFSVFQSSFTTLPFVNQMQNLHGREISITTINVIKLQ